MAAIPCIHIPRTARPYCDEDTYWVVTGWAVETALAEQVLKERRGMAADDEISGPRHLVQAHLLVDDLASLGCRLNLQLQLCHTIDADSDIEEPAFGSCMITRDLPYGAYSDISTSYIIFVVVNDVPAIGDDYVLRDDDPRLQVSVEGMTKSLKDVAFEEAFGMLSDDLKRHVTWRTLPNPALLKKWFRIFIDAGYAKEAVLTGSATTNE